MLRVQFAIVCQIVCIFLYQNQQVSSQKQILHQQYFADLSSDESRYSQSYQDETAVYAHSRTLTEESADIYMNGNGSRKVFTKPDLIIAQIRGYDVMNLIYQRYEFHNWYWYQFFLGSFNMPNRTWDLIKYKVAKKHMEYVAFGKKQHFLMIFGGSSVTAGHDNFFNQSYPMVFHRRMSPIFDALGIELFARNIAHGASPCRPSDLCYEAMGGNNPDWTSWEQSYNCKSADIFELMARTAVLNRGIVHFTASGAFVPDNCEMSNDTIPWVSEQWTPELVNIEDKLLPDKGFLDNLKSTLNAWYEDGNAIARFSSPLGGKYDGAGIHGFSVWGRSNRMYQDINRTQTFAADGYNMKPPCHDQGGPHWMSKQTALYEIGTAFKKWHPSVGFHMLRGEVLAYNYLAAIIDAINMMQGDLKSNKPEALWTKYKSKLDEMYIPPPERTIHCWNEECGTKARCYTDFTPNYNPDHLLDKIIVGDHTGWEWTWKGQIHDKKWGYLDHKPGYDTHTPNAKINFKIDIPRDHSLVVVCGTVKDSLKHAKFYLDINATNIGPDYKLARDKNLTDINANMKLHGDECYNLWDIPCGKHVLTIISDQHHPATSITHLITFD